MFREIFNKLIILILVVVVVFGGILIFNSIKPQAEYSPTASLQPTITVGIVTTGGKMAVEKGDTVSVRYLGSLEDGTVFDTNIVEEAKKANLFHSDNPYSGLDFKAGAGQMIKGFDNAVIGMKEGETKSIKIPPAEAYGAYDPTLVKEFPKADLEQAGITPSVGLRIGTQSGLAGNITAINGPNVTIDFNHFLAGKTLNFKITVEKITKPAK